MFGKQPCNPDPVLQTMCVTFYKATSKWWHTPLYAEIIDNTCHREAHRVILSIDVDCMLVLDGGSALYVVYSSLGSSTCSSPIF